MLGYFLAGARYNKTGQRGYIECIAAVPSCPNDIDEITAPQVYAYTKFQQSLPEALQFFDGDATHEENRDKCGQFRVVINSFGNINQYLPGLFPGQGLIFKQMLEDLFHNHAWYLGKIGCSGFLQTGRTGQASGVIVSASLS